MLFALLENSLRNEKHFNIYASSTRKLTLRGPFLTRGAPVHIQGGAVEHQGAQDRIPLALLQQGEAGGVEGREKRQSVKRVGFQREGVTLLYLTNAASCLDSCKRQSKRVWVHLHRCCLHGCLT